jgi:hypothetical protein
LSLIYKLIPIDAVLNTSGFTPAAVQEKPKKFCAAFCAGFAVAAAFHLGIRIGF